MFHRLNKLTRVGLIRVSNRSIWVRLLVGSFIAIIGSHTLIWTYLAAFLALSAAPHYRIDYGNDEHQDNEGSTCNTNIEVKLTVRTHN
jgi:hypothetical protein